MDGWTNGPNLRNLTARSPDRHAADDAAHWLTDAKAKVSCAKSDAKNRLSEPLIRPRFAAPWLHCTSQFSGFFLKSYTSSCDTLTVRCDALRCGAGGLFFRALLRRRAGKVSIEADG